MKRVHAAAILSCAVLGLGVAHAFPFVYSWHQPASGGRAGASGLYGTGGATDHGLTCAVCHVKNALPSTVGATIVPTPAWQSGDAYQPGQTYSIVVTMTGESRGLAGGVNANLNGFALTVEDVAGKVAGQFTSDGPVPMVGPGASCPTMLPSSWGPTGATRPMNQTTFLTGDCHGILSMPKPGATTWTFKWKAPPAGTGPTTVYYGVVDGDQNGESSLGDDVKAGTIKLKEGVP